MLRCPVCEAKLEISNDRAVCADSHCGTSYPIVAGVPVLINEQSSVFSIDEIVSEHISATNQRRRRLKQTLMSSVPSIANNLKAEKNYETLATLLFRLTENPRLLVVGGRIQGQGMASLASNSSIELVESDVSFGPRTMLLLDAHDIPFEDESFDGVIVQAVLEHVVDPYRCVEEIHRVLKVDGLVYAETPFMQQVHGGRYDFTRFTHLGHRRLFRRFKEIDSGAVGGPGMALAWSYRYFLLSFTESRILRAMIWAFTGYTSFFLKYFDRYLIDKSAALDAAFGISFLGQKRDFDLTDMELIGLYRGAW